MKSVNIEEMNEQPKGMDIIPEKPKLYSPREAAAELVEGVSYKLILAMCKDEKIKCIKSGVNYKITKESLYEALNIPAKYLSV
jgi:hypothetical protein